MIRAFVSDDAPAIEMLWVAAWQAAMPEIDFRKRRAWFREHLHALQAGGAAVLVACVEGRPVGFITVDGTGYVDQLAVDPSAQGRGTGGTLLDAASALQPGGLRLSVNSDNRRAVGFYARHGFTVEGSGTNPRSGLPTLEMVLTART